MPNNQNFKRIKKEIYFSIDRVIKKRQFILGREVERFEKEIASYIGSKYAIGVNTGTDALFYSLKSLNIGPGDEVITSPFSFSSSADAIVMVGAKPIFVDIEPRTFNIDPFKIEQAINKRTKAIILVHLYGQSVNFNPILKIIRKYRLRIIEDVAQSLGSRYKNRFLGTFGDLGCLSFYPTKNLAAFGDGGAILTNSPKIDKYLRLMRIHGAQKIYYNYPLIGGSSRLHVLQAAILRVKLKYLDWFIGQRRKIADIYYKYLQGISLIKLPYQDPVSFHSFNHFTIRIKRKRNELYKFLERNNIPVAIIYPKPIHFFKSYNFLGYHRGDFPEAEKAAKEVLSLPTDPKITEKEGKKIAILIKTFLKE